MKKLAIFSLIALFSAAPLYAQADSDVVQIGVRGGANFATVKGDAFESPNSRTSFYAGFVAEVPYSNRFSLQAEVYYSGQGFDINDTNQGALNTSGNTEYQLGYIQIPLMAKFYLVEGLNIHIGPQIGFLVNEEVDFQPTTDSGDVPVPESLSQTQDIDFSVVGGVGYKFDNGFFIQGRYIYGFSKVIQDLNVHNAIWQVGVGFMF